MKGGVYFLERTQRYYVLVREGSAFSNGEFMTNNCMGLIDTWSAPSNVLRHCGFKTLKAAKKQWERWKKQEAIEHLDDLEFVERLT